MYYRNNHKHFVKKKKPQTLKVHQLVKGDILNTNPTKMVSNQSINIKNKIIKKVLINQFSELFLVNFFL